MKTGIKCRFARGAGIFASQRGFALGILPRNCSINCGAFKCRRVFSILSTCMPALSPGFCWNWLPFQDLTCGLHSQYMIEPVFAVDLHDVHQAYGMKSNKDFHYCSLCRRRKSDRLIHLNRSIWTEHTGTFWEQLLEIRLCLYSLFPFAACCSNQMWPVKYDPNFAGHWKYEGKVKFSVLILSELTNFISMHQMQEW